MIAYAKVIITLISGNTTIGLIIRIEMDVICQHPYLTILMIGQLLWVIYIMPETKGISLEEIQKKLGVK